MHFMTRRFSGTVLVATLAFFTIAEPSHGASSHEGARQIVSAARSTLARFLADPDTPTFRDHLRQATAVLIVPRRVRAGLIFGGSGGVGILVAREPGGRDWSEPVFYNLGGASLGLQIGGDRSELVLVMSKENALDDFLSSRFQLGGEIAVAAGPVGNGTGEQIGAPMIAFIRSKGLYAGASLDGTVVRPAGDRNSAYYGRDVTPVDILVRRTVSSDESIGLQEDLARAVAFDPSPSRP